MGLRSPEGLEAWDGGGAIPRRAAPRPLLAVRRKRRTNARRYVSCGALWKGQEAFRA
jgi:hypothetical protein